MAAKTFVQMQEWVAGKANVSERFTSYASHIKDALYSAITLVNQRTWFFLQTSASLTLLSGNDSVNLPSDFGTHNALSIQINGQWVADDGGAFSQVSFDDLRILANENSTAGTPMAFAYYASTLRFAPSAGADYSLRLDYYKGDSSLPSADGDASVWFGDEAQHIVLYAALAAFQRDTLHETAEIWGASEAHAEVHLKALSRRDVYRTGNTRLK